MGPIQSLNELLAVLRVRAGLIALVSVIGILLALFVALRSDAVYQARAIIQVQSAMLSDGESAQGSAARGLQQIEQRIMSRDNLLAMANRFELFEGLTNQERADLMRASLTLNSVAAVAMGFGSDGAVSSLMILARADSAGTAADLANYVADMIVVLSTEFRVDRVRESTAFFRAEENRLAATLTAVEDQIEAFKIENFDLLPGNVAGRALELQALEERLRVVRREMTGLEAEIAELEAEATRVTTQRRLLILREQLDTRRIEETELDAAVGELQPMLRRLPQIERELSALERREEQLRAQLRATSERRAQAELGARLETDQQSERYELLEAAIVPDYPISRSKRVVVMMGVVASVGLALGLALVQEFLNPVLRTPSQLERAIGLRPVLTVPAFDTPQQRRKTAVGWISGLALAALAAVAVILHTRQS